jgi:hypothetical protein
MQKVENDASRATASQFAEHQEKLSALGFSPADGPLTF